MNQEIMIKIKLMIYQINVTHFNNKEMNNLKKFMNY